MGFHSFVPPAPHPQIDARPVLIEGFLGLVGSESHTVTITAAELGGANAIMFVHETPPGGNQGRLRIVAEVKATTGEIALEREWGEFPGDPSYRRRTWRLPVVLPSHGGDVRLTLNNPNPTANRNFALRAYALRGADLTPRPATTGFFYPEPPSPSVSEPDVEQGILIPTIPPEYRHARVEGASEGGEGDWELRVERHLEGALTPDRDPDVHAAYVVNKSVEVSQSMGGQVRGGATFNTAGIQALGVSLFAALLDGDSPDRLGFTITLLP